MAFCSNCGTPAAPGSPACARCGAPLDHPGGAGPPGSPTPGPPPQAAWPQQILPPQGAGPQQGAWPQQGPQGPPPQGAWPQGPQGPQQGAWPQGPQGPPQQQGAWPQGPQGPPQQGTWPGAGQQQAAPPQGAWPQQGAGPQPQGAWPQQQAGGQPGWPQHPWPTPSGAVPLGTAHGPSVQDKVSHAFDQLVKDIRSFSFKWVVPIDTALSPEFVRNRSVWVMLLFGFFPLISLFFNLVTTAEGIVQMLMIYFALAWAGYYYYFVARRTVDLAVGFGVMAFTALIGIKGVLMVQSLPGLKWLYDGLPHPGQEGGDAVRAFMGFVLGVGPVEEGFKAFPLLILAFGMKRIEKPIDGIFYGAMSGLGFAITEGSQYIANGGIVQVLFRSTSLPFLHSLWSGIVGYFIALAVVNRSRAPALIIAGYCVGAVLHGTYDFSSGGLVGVLMCAFTYLLFVSYMERSQAMVAELQIAEKEAEEQAKMQLLWQQQYGGYAMPSALVAPPWPQSAPAQPWPQAASPPLPPQ